MKLLEYLDVWHIFGRRVLPISSTFTHNFKVGEIHENLVTSVNVFHQKISPAGM